MKSRRAEYQRNMDYIVEKINDLPNKDNDAKYYNDIIFYRFYTSIQAIMDIIAMVCKDFGISVKDDYSNIDELKDRQLFDQNLFKKLQKLIELRNALVHKYDHIENTLIEQEKEEIVSDIHIIIQYVEKILNEQPESTSEQSD